MSGGRIQRGTGFADHFSGHAVEYARHRPTYPDSLFEWLAGRCGRRELAWDAGSGSGQAAAGLAGQFRMVAAADASLPQLREAPAHPRVHRLCARAEASALTDACADLVACAQSAHWFEQDAFHSEVRRVARPGALVALWCYELATVTPGVDALVREFHDDALGPYWPPERRHIETGYRELPFPYREIETPSFEFTASWDSEEFCAYLGTWSAYRRYRAARADDPLAALQPRLVEHWGEGRRTVRWPLAIRAGYAE